jgi:tetratricopeptide (TPR) repeat protein
MDVMPLTNAKRFCRLRGPLVACLLAGLAFAQASPQPPSLAPQKASALPNAPAPAPVNPVVAEARQLAEQGDYETAMAKLQELAAKDPTIKGLSAEMGATLYKKGDYLKAAEYFQKALAENPKDDESTQLLGLSYYLAGRPSEAIPLLEKVQSWYPRANVDASYILGIAYIQTKDYDHARAAFAHMFDVSPDSASAYLFTARMLFRQEFGPIAEQFALKATQLDPKLPGAHFLLGELYLYKSRIPDAITQLQSELAINPADAAVYYKLADAYSRMQKFDDAERLLQRSIWLDATSTGPFILLGKVLEKKGEYDLAARALQRAANMDPNNPITHHLLGQTYRDMGKKDAADAELKLAEQLRTRQDQQP